MPFPTFFSVFQGVKMTDPKVIENNAFVWIVKISRFREGGGIEKEDIGIQS